MIETYVYIHQLKLNKWFYQVTKQPDVISKKSSAGASYDSKIVIDNKGPIFFSFLHKRFYSKIHERKKNKLYIF